MTRFKHTALNGHNLTMQSQFIQNLIKGLCTDVFPELAGKKGVLFSNTTLNWFMENEFLHEIYDLSAETKRSITTYSSGEQKKALLVWLLKQNPDFLVLDNPFDALDVASVNELQKQLVEIATHKTVIQVIKRKTDLLPFITHGMQINDGKVVYSDVIASYLTKYFSNQSFAFSGALPQPISGYNLQTDQLVQFSGVNVWYEHKQILNNISWTIKPGQFWQLIGPNGCGKSTLLTMINGDNPKAYGQNIKLFGRQKGSGENVWQIKKLIGYFTPSMMYLFKHRHNAEQMIISGLVDSIGLYQKATDMQLHLAHKWLNLIGVYHKKNEPFITLSQIEQRMVLIARAMVKHPPLLILDEPSTGLDDYSAAMLSGLINKMANESSTAIIYVSHRSEPELLPDYVYELTQTPNGAIGKVIKTKL